MCLETLDNLIEIGHSGPCLLGHSPRPNLNQPNQAKLEGKLQESQFSSPIFFTRTLSKTADIPRFKSFFWPFFCLAKTALLHLAPRRYSVSDYLSRILVTAGFPVALWLSSIISPARPTWRRRQRHLRDPLAISRPERKSLAPKMRRPSRVPQRKLWCGSRICASSLFPLQFTCSAIWIDPILVGLLF